MQTGVLGNGQLLTDTFQGGFEAGTALALCRCGLKVMQSRYRFAVYIAPAELFPKLTKHYRVKQRMAPG